MAEPARADIHLIRSKIPNELVIVRDLRVAKSVTSGVNWRLGGLAI
jgi:hypothetical protein